MLLVFFTHTIFLSRLICLHFLWDAFWTYYYLCWSCLNMTPPPPGITILSNSGTLYEHNYFFILIVYFFIQTIKNHIKRSTGSNRFKFRTIIGQRFSNNISKIHARETQSRYDPFMYNTPILQIHFHSKIFVNIGVFTPL